MPNTILTRTIVDTPYEIVVQMDGLFDGASGDEANVNKVVLSTLKSYNGNAAPSALSIDWLQYNISGGTSLTLQYDHTTPDIIARLAPGAGRIDYGGLQDPRSAGGTGNIQITTTGMGAVANARYSLVARFLKQK